MPDADPFLEDPLNRHAVLCVLDEISNGTPPQQAARNIASSEILELLPASKRSAVALLATWRAIQAQADIDLMCLGAE